MSAVAASRWPGASWRRPGHQVDGLSHIFVSSFDARSRRRFLSELLAKNRATVEQNSTLGCRSLVGFALVIAIHSALRLNQTLNHDESSLWRLEASGER
jgi:hypothetical protein